MSVPIFIWVALSTIGIFSTLMSHGEVKKKNAVNSFIGLILQVGILYWGHFFSRLGFPQAMYIGMTTLGAFLVIRDHGQETTTHAFYDIISIGLFNLLLWWGGFFG